MEVESLIQEMKGCKLANPALELQEILKIFEIKAMRDLAKEIAAARLAK